MRRQLNFKLLTIALAVLVAAAGVVHAVHIVQMGRNAQAMLHLADRALEQKEYARAASLYHHYLQYQPDDTEAITHYATALDKSTSSGQARYQTYFLLEQVLRRQPQRDDIRRQVVQLAIEQERFDEAVRHLEQLTLAGPDKGKYLHQLGWCQEALRQYAASAESFRKAIAAAPAQLDSYVLLAELLEHRFEQPGEAQQVMDNMIAANAQSWLAYLTRARFHFGRGALPACDADIAQASQLAPEEPQVLLAAAEIALVRGNLPAARQAVTRGLALDPKNGRLYRSLAALELRSGHPSEAAACLRRGIDQLPESVELRVQLAEIFVELDQAREAQALLDWLAKHDAPPALLDYVSGRLLMAGARWQEALDKLSAARNQLGSGSEYAARIWSCLGQCFEKLGDVQSQLAACREAVLLQSSDARARMNLARALLACHSPDEAVAEMRQLMTVPNVPAEAWVLLARTLVERYKQLPPDGTALRELDDILEKATALAPPTAELACVRADALVIAGQPAAGMALLRAQLKEHPDWLPLWTSLASDLVRHDQGFEAKLILDEAQRRLGPSLELDRALVRFWAQRPATEARAGLTRIARAPGPLAPHELVVLYRELAWGLLWVDDRAEAALVLEKLKQLMPKDLSSRLQLFDLALEDRRDNQVKSLIGEIRDLEGADGVWWRAAEAARSIRLAQEGNTAELKLARQRLQEIRQRRQRWARAELLQGLIDQAEGKTEQAIEYYRKAIDLGDRSPAIGLAVARWLSGQQRYTEAERIIRLMEEQGPLSRDLARLGAEVAIYNHDFKRAVVLAGKVAPPGTRDYREQLWLAQIQWLAGDTFDAEDTLRRALDSSPRVPEVWVAMARHLRRTQQLRRLDDLLDKMAATLPDERLITARAQCLEVAGQWQQAETWYQKALDKTPDDFVLLRQVADFYLHAEQYERANSFLRRLLEVEVAAPADIKAWARRQRAMIFGLAGGTGNVSEPLSWLDNNMTNGELSMADKRVKALVLSTIPDRRADAVHLFEQTMGRQPLTADEQFMLAHVYEAHRSFGKSGMQMLLLLKFNEDNPLYLAYQVRSVLVRGELDEAQAYCQRLENVEPQSARTLALKNQVRQSKE
jgi:tetratricopeptide (TPR) repeat protein